MSKFLGSAISIYLVYFTFLSQLCAGSILVTLGPDSDWEHVQALAKDILDNSDVDLLGIHSVGLRPGQTNFDEQTVKYKLIAGGNNLKIAAFSDDGVDIDIKDITAGTMHTGILKNKGKGQALPNLGQSLKQIDFKFIKSHEYEITVGYLNTYYTGQGDIDGALLIAYGDIIYSAVPSFTIVEVGTDNPGPLFTNLEKVNLKLKIDKEPSLDLQAQWQIIEKPKGSNFVSEPFYVSSAADFTPDVPGKYVVKAEFYNKSDTIEVHVISLMLVSLEFKSDHNLIRKGTSGPEWEDKELYPNIEWYPGKGPEGVDVNAPITHDIGKKMELELVCDGYIPSNCKFRLLGKRDQGLVFDSGERLFVNGGDFNWVFSDVKSLLSVACSIEVKDPTIDWSATFSTSLGSSRGEISLGSSGPHRIYKTFGTPTVTPTIPKLEMGLGIIRSAIQNTGATNCNYCYSGIINEMNKSQGKYYLGRNMVRNLGSTWRLPEVQTTQGAFNYDGNEKTGADCITIANFLTKMCGLFGIPGTFKDKFYAAKYRLIDDLKRPERAFEGFLDDVKDGTYGKAIAPIDPAAGEVNPSWFLALADHSTTNEVKPGGRNGFNNFEAALEYTYNGGTLYFPGGVPGTVFDNKNDIVQVFKALVWVAEVDGDGDGPNTKKELELQAVDFRYKGAQSVAPCP